MIKRSRPVYLADALVDVEVVTIVRLPDGAEKRIVHTVTLAAERRGTGRAVVFPRPTVELDQQHKPVAITLHTRSWLINDGVVGTLPLRADDQRAARAAADEFVRATQHDVVDSVPAQVDNWCQWYARDNADAVELIVGWSVRVQHIEQLPAPVMVALPTHVEGVLAPEVEGARGPFTPAVDPDSIVTPEQTDVDQAPALAQITEVAQ